MKAEIVFDHTQESVADACKQNSDSIEKLIDDVSNCKSKSTAVEFILENSDNIVEAVIVAIVAGKQLQRMAIMHSFFGQLSDES